MPEELEEIDIDDIKLNPTNSEINFESKYGKKIAARRRLCRSLGVTERPFPCLGMSWKGWKPDPQRPIVTDELPEVQKGTE